MTLVTVEIEGLPCTVDEFTALRDKQARTPEGGAAMMVTALLLYTDDVTLGLSCLAIAVASSRLQDDPNGYRGRQLPPRDLSLIRMQLGQWPYIPRSYLQGAAPEEGYTLPQPPYTIQVSRHPYGSEEKYARLLGLGWRLPVVRPTATADEERLGRIKVFVASSGASSLRPVTCVCNDAGIWKAEEWSSLLSGVRPPSNSPKEEL